MQRGMAYWGSGRRLRRVAAKLLAGQPIRAVTLGGSVTYGNGASSSGRAYAGRFFQFIRAAFPHRRVHARAARQRLVAAQLVPVVSTADGH